MIYNFIKNFSRKYWINELEELDTLRSEKVFLEINLNKLHNLNKKNKELELNSSKSDIRITNLLKIIDSNGWDNPYNWITYKPNYKTIDGLKVPPNTFITLNDKYIKKLLISRGFHKLSLEKLIWKLELWCFKRMKYVLDTFNGSDDWRNASYSIRNKKGDCDNFAILFQTCMHILGYGNKCICKTAGVKLGTDEIIGHMYNKVLINDKWIIVDPTNPKKYRDNWKIIEYDIDMHGLGFFFNYWGTYKNKKI